MLNRWNGDPDVASAVLTAGFVDYPVPQSETRDDVERQVSDGTMSAEASWIAVREGIAIGGIFAAMRADRRARVQSMAVAPEHRRRGIGRELLAAFLAGVDAAGIVAVHLEVIDTNVAARSLYESAGFKPVRALNCLRTVPERTATGVAVPSPLAKPLTVAPSFAGPPDEYKTSNAPLHRDSYALARMQNVVFHQLPSGAWSAHRGNVLLAVEDWTDEEELRILLAAMPAGAALKMIDVPEGDLLGAGLLALGWVVYTRQIEMIRPAGIDSSAHG